MNHTASPLRNGSTINPRFTLIEDEEDEQLVRSSNSHRPQAAFEVDMEDTGDDLLDWEQYSKARTVRVFGREFSLTPPTWWFSLTRSQRRLVLAGACCMVAFFLLVLLLSAAAAARGGLLRGLHARASEKMCHWTEWRLPPGISPTRYNITFDVKMHPPWDVKGSADIAIHLAHESRCIVLHVADVSVTEAYVGGAPATKRYDQVLEQLTLEWPSVIPPGPAALHLQFQYTLSEGMTGFYRSTYSVRTSSGGNGDGKRLDEVASMAATQFEANAARSAFPCFDEPALKAVFAVEVITDAGLTVLSNMPPLATHRHEHQEEGTMTWHFQPTPPMSTYLLAVVIGNLTSVDREVAPPLMAWPSPLGPLASGADGGGGGGSSSSTPTGGGDGSTRDKYLPPFIDPDAMRQPRRVSVWGTPERISQLDFAADVAAAVLPAYEAALGVPFALPKLDLVAVPDFSAGAMENWGCITYRETALLVSPTSGVKDQRHVAQVVAHEMAHQWFGNLVTMDWWSELWLNEGFASYFEYYGATAGRPDLDFFQHFYAQDVPFALRFDSQRASHPMSMDPGTVNSTDRIESLFDAVEYERGSAVLRMLRSWINRGNASAPTPETWELPSTVVGRPDSDAATSTTATSDSSPSPERAPSTVAVPSDPFFLGLHRYLAAHAFNSTTAAQLWSSVASSTGVDLPALMQDWTYSQGYPLITVSIDPKRSVWLQQAPFSLDGVGLCSPTAGAAWWVPVPYLSSEAPLATKWGELNACQGLRPLISVALPKGGWVKVNANQYGYYRVNYESELWDALAVAAAQRDANGINVLSGVDVAGLLDDSFALIEAGAVEVSVFLQLAVALPERPAFDYDAWAVALPKLYRIESLVPCASEWRAWVRSNLVEPFMRNATAAAEKSGAEPIDFSFIGIMASAGNENATGASSSEGAAASSGPGKRSMGFKLLRPSLLRAAGLFGNESLSAEATRLVSTLAAETTRPATTIPGSTPPTIELDPDVRAAVYQVAARASTDADATFLGLQQLYLAATQADERDRVLCALGHSPLAVPAALELALSDAVKAQDVRSLVVTSAGAGDAERVRAVWDWFKVNWDRLHAKLGGDDEASRRMGQILEGIASGLVDRKAVEEVDAMFTAHVAKQSEPGYALRAKEAIETNARWVEHHGQKVCSWIEERMGGKR